MYQLPVAIFALFLDIEAVSWMVNWYGKKMQPLIKLTCQTPIITGWLK